MPCSPRPDLKSTNTSFLEMLRLAENGDRSLHGIELCTLVMRHEKRGMMGLGRFEAMHLSKVRGLVRPVA